MINQTIDRESSSIGWIAMTDLLILAVAVIVGYTQTLTVSKKKSESELTKARSESVETAKDRDAIDKERKQLAIDVGLSNEREDVLALSIQDALNKNSSLATQLKANENELAIHKTRIGNLQRIADEANAKHQKAMEDLNTATSQLSNFRSEKALFDAQMVAGIEQLELLLGTSSARSGKDPVKNIGSIAVEAKAKFDRLSTQLKKSASEVQERSLALSALQVTEKGYRQELLGIKSRSDRLGRVAFIVDRSQSMNDPVGGRTGNGNLDRWEYVKGIVKVWLKRLPCDEAILVSFSDKAERFPVVGSFTVSSDGSTELLNVLENLQPGGMTNTFEALDLALKMDEIDSIILFTDGRPTVGPKNENGDFESEVVTLVKNHVASCVQVSRVPVPINVIGLGDYFGVSQATGDKKPESKARTFGGFLIELAELSGGTFIGR